MADLQRAAARKWQGDPACQQAGLFARAATEIERLRAALLDCAIRCEALKRPCGMDPESPQALRNGHYMSIALAARLALGPNRCR